MDVIPVIDLKGGVVVHARRGDRARYRPIESPLSPTATPLDVVTGLMALHPFRRLYIADLDAIGGTGDNRADVWGRPAGLTIAADGALMIADDAGDTIWRVTWRGR